MPSPAEKDGAENGSPDQESGRRGLYGQRPSKSHDELIRKEFERVAAMTARERMVEALALDSEIASLLVPVDEDSTKGESSK